MRLILAFGLFLSGAASLIFETIWTRELALVFGSTTLAISTILSTFMGGLGLGSLFVARRMTRVRDPLRAYGLTEAALGAYALMVPSLFRALPPLRAAIQGSLGEHTWALTAVEALASIVVIGTPTFLMGFTLPLAATAAIALGNESAPVRVGRLYALNTTGALVGAMVAGFVLLPALGLRATNAVAALADLAVAAAVLLAAHRGATAPSLRAPETEPPPRPLPPAARLALGAFAISGASAMVLEVLWSRALAIVLGSSVYAFTLILVAFLGGIAGGARLFSARAGRTREPGALLARLHLFVATTVLLTKLFIDRLPLLFLALARGHARPSTLLAVDLLAAVAVILPPAIVMGAIFPVTLRLCNQDRRSIGTTVGAAYAVNSAGAIVGALVAGFVLLPGLGLERGILLIALLEIAVGALLTARLAESRFTRRRVIWLAPAGLVAAVALLPRWDLGLLQSGLFRTGDARTAVEQPGFKLSAWRRERPVFYRDGISSSVSVEHLGDYYGLRNNGKPDASTRSDMETQILLGLLPISFAPAPQPRVAVIGYGSGVTVGATLQAATASVDAVELEPAVIEADRFFAAVNQQALADPRVRLHLTDGRSWLGATRQRFDVVISEPPNPWVAGVANLFTREFWQIAHDRLAPDGVFCQWLQAYELSPSSFRTLIRTFADSFRYTYVFANSGNYDMFLLGSDTPLVFERAAIAQRLAAPRLAAEAARAQVRRPDDLFARLLLAPDDIEQFTAGAPLNTDDNGRIEYAAPLEMLAHDDAELVRMLRADAWQYGKVERLLAAGDAIDDKLVGSLLALGRLARARELTDQLALLGDDRAGVLSKLLLERTAMPLQPPAVHTHDEDSLSTTLAAELLFDRGQPADARLMLAQLAPLTRTDGNRPKLFERDADVALAIGLAGIHLDWPEPVVQALGGVERDEKLCAQQPLVMLVLARAYYRLGRRAEGVALLERFLDSRLIASN